jgi:hypothetical protein
MVSGNVVPGIKRNKIRSGVGNFFMIYELV